LLLLLKLLLLEEVLVARSLARTYRVLLVIEVGNSERRLPALPRLGQVTSLSSWLRRRRKGTAPNPTWRAGHGNP
jgi:hypothetical protein